MNRSGSKSTGGSQACAACKYHRRKCVPNCPLAPFFPPHRQEEFLNAHKLFGVSNMLKIIRNLDPQQKAHAMSSMIYEADARASDPVGGCYNIIGNLCRQLERVRAELNFVRRQLSICRSRSEEAAIASTNGNANGDSLIICEQSASNAVQTCLDAPYKEETFEDVSEDVKPFLGAFSERDNTVFLASLSDKMVLEEDCKPINYEQERDISGGAQPFPLTNCRT